MRFSQDNSYEKSLIPAARAAVNQVLAVRKGERVLVISNPSSEVRQVALALFDASAEAGALPVLMVQQEKGQFDFAEEEVIKAIASNPDVVISISKDRLGKDRSGMKSRYKDKGGKPKYDHIFDMLHEEKRMRTFWSPGTTVEMFSRTVPIDYAQVRSDCRRLGRMVGDSDAMRVTAPGGTDITLSIVDRKPRFDDGDFRKPGQGGNLPSGEVYVSPVVGTADGTIAFDGSIAVNGGDIVVKGGPVEVRVEKGFVCSISGGAEAVELQKSVELGEKKAVSLLKKGQISETLAKQYERNARNIGELGIGLNRMARIAGNMLEDEKVYGTCHFAIGENYDHDALALIHLDGLVKSPTIVGKKANGREYHMMSDGRLAWE